MIAHPPSHPRYHQLVDAIDYYPDATFERTFTGCRCFVLTVSYVPPLDSTGGHSARPAGPKGPSSARPVSRGDPSPGEMVNRSKDEWLRVAAEVQGVRPPRRHHRPGVIEPGPDEKRLDHPRPRQRDGGGGGNRGGRNASRSSSREEDGP